MLERLGSAAEPYSVAVPPRIDLSLASVLRTCITCVCLGILTLYALTTWHSRAIAVDVARREAGNLTESLAQQAADSVEAAGGALQWIVGRIEADGLDEQARIVLHETMAQAVVAMPRIRSLRISDEQGRIILDSGSSAGEPDLNLRNSELYRYHRGNESQTPFISGPTRSASEQTWIISVSRRIDRSDGQFAGVVVAEIPLDYFEQIYAKVNIGKLGVIDLVRDNGIVMVRRPLVSSFIGRSIANDAIFTSAMKGEASGSDVYNSVLDGVRRLNAFRRLDGYPLVIIVALSERELLANWYRDAWINLAATAGLVLFISVLGSVLIKQIGHRKAAEEALARLALLDGLTGIANRRQFDTALSAEWLRAIHDGSSISLLMIDADHFKTYNDRYGHPCGDEVLKAISAAIAENIRSRDLGARYGGEEFAVVLPSTNAQEAFAIAERIRSAIAAVHLANNEPLSAGVTVSIGVTTTVPTDKAGPARLIATADRALYIAKDAGRDRTAVLAFDLNEDNLERDAAAPRKGA